MNGYKTIETSTGAGIFTRFLYNTVVGRIFLSLLVRPRVSKLAGTILNRRVSKIFINRFARKSNIDMGEYKNVRYKSFNDFFIRKIEQNRRPFPENARDLAAPCDGKLTVYQITNDRLFNIKNSSYNINDLLRDDNLTNEFTGGYCLIFRLTPDDYHRYCYIDDGEILSRKKINGVLHTVRPIALRRYNVYAQNAREYTVMQTRNFGKVIQMEVGAMLVGKITNHQKDSSFSRGEEKGYFEFGGSTIVLLLQKNTVKLEEEIFANSARDLETVVKQGTKIGTAI